MRISKPFTILSLCTLVALGIAACASANSADNSNPLLQQTPASDRAGTPEVMPILMPKQIGEKRMDADLVAANNAFGFDLFGQLLTEDKGKNVFFSPLSIALALEMTYNGAAGETHDAMAKALKLKGINHAQLNESAAELMKTLKSNDPKIELSIANSLWARQGKKFNEAFLERNRQFFGAEVASIDFASPKAKDTINDWVSKNTKGKIPAIIDRIDAQQAMFLINAVYFKGQWQKKFDKAQTTDEPFYLASAGQKTVPLMSQSGNYQYYRGEKFQAVSLPYGQGGTNLYLFLPDKGASLGDFLKGLSFEKWEQWMNSFRSTPGDIKIPRFKLDYDHSLNQSLMALGMGVAFTSRADFSGIRAERDLMISEVKHKAIVEVNEEGTEAAAATSVGMVTTSIRAPQQRFTFIADHPFLMAIRNQQTGAILFLGAVVEPK